MEDFSVSVDRNFEVISKTFASELCGFHLLIYVSQNERNVFYSEADSFSWETTFLRDGLAEPNAC